MTPPHNRVPGASVLALLVCCLACGGGQATKKQPPLEKNSTYSVRMARSLFEAGRVTEALAELAAAIEREPDNAGLHNYYGQLCLQSARFAEAVPAFRSALEADPYLTDAHNNLGVTYLEMGDFRAAEVELRKALNAPAYPTPQKVWLNLGLLYLKQGRLEEALEALRQSVGIDPKYYKAHFELASVLDQLGQLREAAREYEVAEPAYRNDADYAYRRGFVYYRLGEADKARDAFSRVLTLSPGSQSAAKAQELLDLMD